MPLSVKLGVLLCPHSAPTPAVGRVALVLVRHGPGSVCLLWRATGAMSGPIGSPGAVRTHAGTHQSVRRRDSRVNVRCTPATRQSNRTILSETCACAKFGGNGVRRGFVCPCNKENT